MRLPGIVASRLVGMTLVIEVNEMIRPRRERRLVNLPAERREQVDPGHVGARRSFVLGTQQSRACRVRRGVSSEEFALVWAAAIIAATSL